MKNTLITNDLLSELQWKQVVSLGHLCEIHDHFYTKIYPNIIKNKRLCKSNFLLYKDNMLVSYLSFFQFEPDAVYIAAITHPDYRNKGLFNKLFSEAKTTIQSLGYSKILFTISGKNIFLKSYFRNHPAKYLRSEFHMIRRDKQQEIIPSPTLSLKLADKNDIEQLALLDSRCFDTNYETMLERFRHTLQENKRRSYLAIVNNIAIGKAHVHFQDELILIHDICILPDWQNQSYGTQLIKLIVNLLIEEGYCETHLDVIANNDSAIKIYQKCHFKVSEEYEVWGLGN